MPAETEALVQEIIAAHGNMEGAALPILHAVQEAIGYVPEDAIPLIAEALNVTRAEMYGVVTFYHDFRREPAGRHVAEALPGGSLSGGGGSCGRRPHPPETRHRLRRDLRRRRA